MQRAILQLAKIKLDHPDLRGWMQPDPGEIAIHSMIADPGAGCPRAPNQNLADPLLGAYGKGRCAAITVLSVGTGCTQETLTILWLARHSVRC